VTDERPMVSFAHDDLVIPPSGTVDPAKIKDEDTVEEMYSDASIVFTSASNTYRTSADVCLDRRMLPQHCDMIGKQVDGRIAIGAHSDGLPLGSSIRARGDRRTSGEVSPQIECAEYSPDCSFYLTDKRPHVLRQPPPRSLSRYCLWIEKSDEDDDSYCHEPWKMFCVGGKVFIATKQKILPR